MGHHEVVTCSHFVPKVVTWQVSAQLQQSIEVRLTVFYTLSRKSG